MQKRTSVLCIFYHSNKFFSRFCQGVFCDYKRKYQQNRSFERTFAHNLLHRARNRTPQIVDTKKQYRYTVLFSLCKKHTIPPSEVPCLLPALWLSFCLWRCISAFLLPPFSQLHLFSWPCPHTIPFLPLILHSL